MHALHDLADDELLASLHELVASERRLRARLVRILSEVEQRRLHLRYGHPSMFDFCVRRLGLSESEAFRRIAAARLARRFPRVLEMLDEGSLHLSALMVLREHLTEENHENLLAAAAGRTKREVEELVARYYPRPDVPATIRALPTRSRTVSAGENSAPAPLLLRPQQAASPSEKRTTGATHRSPPTPAARVNPLSSDRYRVQFTASGELKAKIERARDLLSHAVPNGDLEAVMERALDALLAGLERRKLCKLARARSVESSHPANDARAALQRARTKRALAVGASGSPGPAADANDAAESSTNGASGAPSEEPAQNVERPRDPGAVSRQARREVFVRDGLRCSFVGHEGRRCTARAFLEIDHVHARARGGAGTRDNLRVLCRAHNQLLAEQSFGRDYVEWCVTQRRRAR